MNCDVCGAATDSLMFVGRGLVDEMGLCERCAEAAFPGLQQMMRHDCPVCRADAADWN